MAFNYYPCRCGTLVWDRETHNLPGMCGANITEALTGTPAPTLTEPEPLVTLPEVAASIVLPSQAAGPVSLPSLTKRSTDVG